MESKAVLVAGGIPAVAVESDQADGSLRRTRRRRADSRETRVNECHGRVLRRVTANIHEMVDRVLGMVDAETSAQNKLAVAEWVIGETESRLPVLVMIVHQAAVDSRRLR